MCEYGETPMANERRTFDGRRLDAELACVHCDSDRRHAAVLAGALMTNLVADLREAAIECYRGEEDLYTLAATEIERLQRLCIEQGSQIMRLSTQVEQRGCHDAAEPACPHCREVYEIWAGIEGFEPKTASEAYQQRIIEQMREAAAKGSVRAAENRPPEPPAPYLRSLLSEAREAAGVEVLGTDLDERISNVLNRPSEPDGEVGSGGASLGRESRMVDLEPQCEGCGKRPEVYGSSWCAWCQDNVPRAAKNRIIALRNALMWYANTMGASKSRDMRIIVQDAGERARLALRR